MTCRIPEDMRETLAADPWMKYCILARYIPGHVCEGRNQWQHGFNLAGRRINDLFCIYPMCEWAHQREAQYRALQLLVMQMRAAHFGIDIKAKYPRTTLL